MKQSSDLKKIFKKFVNNTLTKREYDTLMEVFEKLENKKELEQLLDEFPLEGKVLDDYDTSENLFQKIVAQIKHEKEHDFQNKVMKMKKMRSVFWYGAAASTALLLGLFFGLQKDFFAGEPDNTSVSIEDPNAITLKQSNGDISVIKENGVQNIIDTEGNVVGSQKGNQLNYKVTENSALQKLVYNELTVPYGKQFDLVLSDGTEIKLNAGTSIKYPVQFIKGQERKVFLNGEAYFDVAKDEQHPFIVNADEVNVQVLGTEFNMSFYPEDANINTVLVEGAINLFEEKDFDIITVLTPGNMASWNKSNQAMSIKKVDVTLYTAWKDGILLFKGTPFNSIRKKLERHFDILIENRYSLLESQVYTASFREESIEEILNAFNEDTPFTYNIENNRITILNTNEQNRQKP